MPSIPVTHALYIYLQESGLLKTAKALRKEVNIPFDQVTKPSISLTPLLQRLAAELERIEGNQNASFTLQDKEIKHEKKEEIKAERKKLKEDAKTEKKKLKEETKAEGKRLKDVAKNDKRQQKETLKGQASDDKYLRTNECPQLSSKKRRIDEKVPSMRLNRLEGAPPPVYLPPPSDAFSSRAAEQLGRVKGRDFRSEKMKKKRASWKGCGSIDMTTRSIRFDSD